MDISLVRLPCDFMAGAANLDALPPFAEPEVAFIGRSNVGKSSLINALVGQKALARTSQNPGATKQLNFFLLGKALMLVDMPGYGFAKVSKEQKGQWDILIHGYLSGRPNLKRICLLIDARRGVMKPDEEFMEMLDETAVSFQIILTKTDAVTPTELTSVLQSLKKTIQSHPAAHPEVIATSAENKDGIEALQQELLQFAKTDEI
jgi:GTP-binding protein